MKKWLSFLLVFVMLLSLVSAALASGEIEEAGEVTEEAAEEVPEEAPAEAAVEEAPAEEPVEEPEEAPAEEPVAEPEEAPATDGAQVGSCGDGVYWRFEDGVLTIYGEGEMYSAYHGNSYKVLSDQVVKVVVQKGVTGVCSHAFNGFTNLETAVLQDGVEDIGAYAFYSCTSLKSIELPGTLYFIFSGAFCDCYRLTDIYYGGSEAQWVHIVKYDSTGSNSLEILTSANIHYSEMPYRWTVFFDAMGGTVSPTSAIVGTDLRLASLPTPTRSGYAFDGWYTTGYVGEKVDTSMVYKENTTIYAHWKSPTKLTRIDLASLETELTGGASFPSKNAVPAAGSHFTNPIYYWEDAWGQVASGIPVVGRYYWLNVYIEPDAGYTFGKAGAKIPVYVNGTKIGDGTVETDVYGRAEMVHFTLRRTGTAGTITAADIELTAPKAGTAIPYPASGVQAKGSHFTIGEQFWCTSYSTMGKITSGSFANGRTYYYYAELIPDDGWEFAGTEGRVTADELSVTANGSAASDSMAKSASGRVTVYIPMKAAGPAQTPAVKLSADGKTAQCTGSFQGLYARVALVLQNGGTSGLYVTQVTINSDGAIVIPSFMVPGLTVKGVNIALVPTLADISSSTPNAKASDFKMLT